MPKWVYVAIGIAAIVFTLYMLGAHFHAPITWSN